MPQILLIMNAGTAHCGNAAAGKRSASRHSQKYHNIDLFVLTSLVLLSCQGLLNSLFADTALVIWKQLLLSLMFILALFGFGAARRSDPIIFVGMAATMVLLFGNSLSFGLDLQSVVFSAFFYVAWIPFYLYGRRASYLNIEPFANVLFYIILFSAAGIMLQLKYGWFSFLVANENSLLWAAREGTAQRLAFVYNASTTVLPTLVGFHYLVCLLLSDKKKLISLACLAISLLPTASLGNSIALIVAIVMTYFGCKRRKFAALFVVAGVIGMMVLIAVDDQLWIQVERILNNDTNSLSSKGRLALWSMAIDLISSFDIEKHFVGLGVGATFSRERVELSAVPHGESSFFQAYLEAGIIGLVYRLLPFALLLKNRSDSTRIVDLSYFSALILTCAVAPIFGTYGVQCMLGFIAGLRLPGKSLSRPETVRYIRNNDRNTSVTTSAGRISNVGWAISPASRATRKP